MLGTAVQHQRGLGHVEISVSLIELLGFYTPSFALTGPFNVLFVDHRVVSFFGMLRILKRVFRDNFCLLCWSLRVGARPDNII